MFNHTETYELLNAKNGAFETYAFWTGILVLKMFLMSIITAVQRTRKKVIMKLDLLLGLIHCRVWRRWRPLCTMDLLVQGLD